MGLDLVQIRKKAEEKADENWQFRRYLKESDLPPEEIDRHVFAITRRVWAGIECTECANCCREVHPTFSEDEVERLAQRLTMDRREFIEKYLKATEPGCDNPWETRTLPCPFLDGNHCSVYDDRPADCKGYPYLDKPHFVSNHGHDGTRIDMSDCVRGTGGVETGPRIPAWPPQAQMNLSIQTAPPSRKRREKGRARKVRLAKGWATAPFPRSVTPLEAHS